MDFKNIFTTIIDFLVAKSDLVAPIVTLLIGLGTIWMQRSNNSKQLKKQEELSLQQLQAQVLARARIDKLKEMRKIFAQFVERSAEYNSVLRKMQFDLKKEQSKTYQELAVEYELISKQTYFWASYRLLQTYFPSSDENNKMLELLKILPSYLDRRRIVLKELNKQNKSTIKVKKNALRLIKKSAPQYYDVMSKERLSVYYSRILEIITLEFSNYIDKEWQKAQSEVIGK